LSEDAIATWRTNFANLVQTGSAAVPALQAFLNEKNDETFSQEVWQTLGYSSVRLAAIDALRQIGGADAAEAMRGLLTMTQAPREIALLARGLEEASPGQYRQQALSAAQTGLSAALASNDQQTDVAPLFEVFQHYGDASSVPDLVKASEQWGYYATIALASLPDHAGLASVFHMADPTSNNGNRVVALEMVAQLAAASPEARQFLATQVANNAIPANLWAYLPGPLAGDQYYPVDSIITQYPQLQSSSDLKTTHLGGGNQNLYTLPGDLTLTPDGIQQRLDLIDQLLRATTDPAALQALEQARATLGDRSNRSASQPTGAVGKN
jgi:hypothetical protein